MNLRQKLFISSIFPLSVSLPIVSCSSEGDTSDSSATTMGGGDAGTALGGGSTEIAMGGRGTGDSDSREEVTTSSSEGEALSTTTGTSGEPANGCPLADDDFAIVGTVEGELHKYTSGPLVIATSDTHLTVTVGELERWRLVLPKKPGDYDCGEIAGETSIELLVATAFPSTFGEEGSCTLHVESVEGFIRGSFEAHLLSVDQKETFEATGCFNVPNGGVLAGDDGVELPDGAGATIEVTEGNDLTATGIKGVLQSQGAGDQRAGEQMYGNFAGKIGKPEVAASLNFLGLPYAAGTYECGQSPVVDGKTLFAPVSLVVNVGGAYRAEEGSGSCEIVLTGGAPDFEATYQGTFVSGDQSIKAKGTMRFANPKEM